MSNRKQEILQNMGTSLRNFVPKTGLRKFRHSKSIVLSVELLDSRASLFTAFYDGRRVVAAGCPYFTTRLSTIMLYLHYYDLLYNLFLQLCSSWQDLDWHSASRGPSAVAELLVKILWSVKCSGISAWIYTSHYYNLLKIIVRSKYGSVSGRLWSRKNRP